MPDDSYEYFASGRGPGIRLWYYTEILSVGSVLSTLFCNEEVTLLFVNSLLIAY